MSSRQFGSLACKVLGLFFLVQGVTLLFNTFYAILAIPWQKEDIFNIIMSLAVIVFAILLYALSNKLADFMIKDNQEINKEVKEAGITIYNIQRVAFSVLGLFFIGSSLARLVALLLNVFSNISGNAGLLFSAGSPIVEFIIGLIIFLNSWKIVK